MQGLKSAGQQWLARAQGALEHPSRKITAAIAAALLGAGGGAFALASLGPDASALPVRQLLEAVEPLPLQAQSDALDVHSFSLYTSESVRRTDTVDTLLSRLGINDPAAAAFLRADANVRQQLLGLTGRSVRAEATDSRDLVRLTARWAFGEQQLFKRLVVERGADGKLFSRVEIAPLVPSLRLGSGTIRSSLFGAVDDAGIPDAVAMQMVTIFAGDVDFHRGLRKGDRFSVVYETLEADGEPLRTGRVVSAEFANAGRLKQALWFQEAGGTGGYFDFNGESLERMFLASPMEFSRITSKFAMRLHPILNTWRQHNGIDYGAPTGTAVRSVGDGRVQFAGWQNGYGNMVQIDHGGSDSTVYAHLSRLNVRLGQMVRRGESVGLVGATGWATGPHLHFEFRHNGAQRDPIEVARQSQGRTLTAAARPQFDQAVGLMRGQLAAAASTAVVAAMQ